MRGGCFGCPRDYGYEQAIPDACDSKEFTCTDCWDREMPGTEHAKKVGSIEIGIDLKKCKDCQGAGDLRPCEVNGQRCYFHRFIEEERGVLCFNIAAPMDSRTVQRVIEAFEADGVVPDYCNLEKIRHAWALVEFPDGQLKKAEPDAVKFLDRRS